jgi:hypothetical protein
MTKKNLTGQQFGRLTAKYRIIGGKYSFWFCECSCGQSGEFRQAHLESGSTKSCGCLNREIVIARSRTHGMRKSSIYRLWSGMKTRCENPKEKRWKDYGGRGIKVCHRWQRFEHFLEDMGQPPLGSSIERRNNNGDYCPANCKWATRSEQGRNKRNNRILEINGERLCTQEWSERTGVKASVIRKRLDRGWDGRRAVSPR